MYNPITFSILYTVVSIKSHIDFGLFVVGKFSWKVEKSRTSKVLSWKVFVPVGNSDFHQEASSCDTVCFLIHINRLMLFFYWTLKWIKKYEIYFKGVCYYSPKTFSHYAFFTKNTFLARLAVFTSLERSL